ncbi:MAG: hypothetical protein M3R69_02050 [Acidobacteriota bacterium]|nr:hypothetical protein [Acidobacteriota bacterium]
MNKQATKTESDSNAKAGWIFELLKLAVPSLITIFFGYIIYGMQTDIKAKVDSNQEILRNKLAFQAALKEELYKRKLSRYEDACVQLAVTEAALNNAGSQTTEDETRAIDAFIKFEQLNKGNTIYWSQDLQKGLTQFWATGLGKIKEKKWDDREVDQQIINEITALHTQMKSDLEISDLPTITKPGK